MFGLVVRGSSGESLAKVGDGPPFEISFFFFLNGEKKNQLIVLSFNGPGEG